MDLKELLGEHYESIIAATKEKGVTLLVNDDEKPSWLPKDRYDEVLKTKGGLEVKVGQQEKDLADLKKVAGSAEELQKKIDDLEQSNKDWTAKYQDMQLTSALRFEAIKQNANDPDDLLKFFDREKVKLGDDGKVAGLDEQIKSLQEAKPYLFKSEEGTPSAPKQPGNPPKLPPNPNKNPSEMSFAEYQVAFEAGNIK